MNHPGAGDEARGASGRDDVDGRSAVRGVDFLLGGTSSVNTTATTTSISTTGNRPCGGNGGGSAVRITPQFGRSRESRQRCQPVTTWSWFLTRRLRTIDYVPPVVNSSIGRDLEMSLDLLAEKERMLEVGELDSSRMLCERLELIDWNFGERSSGHMVESVHPYPAKFISEIPRSLLLALPMPKGTGVLDPFCGSGTTLCEAQRLGLASVGIDLNPIACLMSRVKTTPKPSGLEQIAATIADSARSNRDPIRWDIPNVDHWFKSDVQKAIAALVQELQTYHVKEAKDALSLALSSILVRVSNQESDTRYAAVEKTIAKTDVFDQFVAASLKIGMALSSRDWALLPSSVIEADTLSVDPADIPMSVGMVITSPPYPNAYEYWLYHKYRMWWLGYDPLAVKAQEIGARAHFFKRECHTEENFWDQMRRAMLLIDTVLVNSGFACFVIGRSKIHGRLINNARIIQTVAEEQGLRLVAQIERVISANRKSFNLSHANIKTETVIVFQKS